MCELFHTGLFVLQRSRLFRVDDLLLVDSVDATPNGLFVQDHPHAVKFPMPALSVVVDGCAITALLRPSSSIRY